MSRLAAMDVVSISADLAQKGSLRASINLGNPVFAQGTARHPTGVAVDIARELASRLTVPLELICFDAARKSFEAMASGQADICFLAIDPARSAEVAFTAPYVVIEGVYVVPEKSRISSLADVDQRGVRIGVKEGSAYDLFLSRSLVRAEVVRDEEGTEVFENLGLEVGAGIREPVSEFVASHSGYRLLDERFMEIQQALGTSKSRRPETVAFLREFIEDLKGSGFIAQSLLRSNQSATVAALA